MSPFVSFSKARVIFTSLIVTLITALFSGCQSTGASPQAPSTSASTDTKSTDTSAHICNSLTPIGLLDLDGHPHALWSSSPAPITVVVFTRTDCPISNRYAPEIRRLYNAYHQRGIELFLIYVDPSESAAAIRTHLRDYNYPCPALRDTEHALVAHCGATITPEAAVFDAQRRLIYRGRINDLYISPGRARPAPTTSELDDAINAACNNRPTPVPRTSAVGCIIADLKK